MAKCNIVKDSNGKWKADKVQIELTDNEVVWSSNKGTEFRVWFPPEWNPLVPGDEVSSGGTLIRTIRPDVRRGNKDRYQYSIFCFSGKEMAEGKSSPEMIIQ